MQKLGWPASKKLAGYSGEIISTAKYTKQLRALVDEYYSNSMARKSDEVKVFSCTAKVTSTLSCGKATNS